MNKLALLPSRVSRVMRNRLTATLSSNALLNTHRRCECSQTPDEVPYMLQPDWSSTDHLQRISPPRTGIISSEYSQLQWLDEAQYRLKGYWLSEAERALEAARTCAGADPSMQRQLLLEMVLSCKQRKGNEAMRIAIRMLKRYPMFATDPVGLANLGTIFALNGDYTRTRLVLEKVPKSHPVYADQVASWLAEAYSMLGEHDKAEPIIASVCESYKDLNENEIQMELKAAAKDPESLDLDEHGWTCLRIKNLQLWGATLLELDNSEKAVSVLQQAVREGIRIMGHEDVITANAKNLLGLALLRCGREDAALRFMKEAVNFLENRLEKGDENVRITLALLRAHYEKRNECEKALHFAFRHRKMTTLLHGGDHDESYASTLCAARLLIQFGKYNDALKELSRVEKSPKYGAQCAELITQCISTISKASATTGV